MLTKERNKWGPVTGSNLTACGEQMVFVLSPTALWTKKKKKNEEESKRQEKTLNNAHKGLTETKVQGMMHQRWQLSWACGLRRKRNMWEWPFGRVTHGAYWTLKLNACTVEPNLRSLWLKCLWRSDDVAVNNFEKGFTNCLATSDVTSSLCHIDFFFYLNCSALSKPAVDHPDWR